MENEEEINLMDYIKVILKRKWLILEITFGAVIIAGILSFVGPTTYKIDTILEVGHKTDIISGVKQIEEFIPEAPDQLVEKIKNNSYGGKIRTKLNISEKEYPEIEVSNPEDTRLIIISIKSSNIEGAKKVLEELESLILGEHQEKFNLQKNILLGSKKRIENKISSLENERKILEEKVDYFTNLMTYNPSPTNQFFSTDVREKLEKKNSEIENEYIRLNTLKQKLISYELTRIIKEPSSILVDPKPLLNIIIALILGLFIGTLLAFCAEWWQKERIVK